MITANFEYHRATSIDEAVNLLKKHGPGTKLLAGGHSLLPTMKLRLSTPSQLIDISRIPELKYIREEGGALAIGPATTHQMIESSGLVKSKAPILSQTAGMIGDMQVRNMGTIGGSLAHADPAADWPAAILASEARIMVKSANGERAIDAADFFKDLFITALQEDEIITEIRVPVQPDNTGAVYQKFVQPASRFAIVGCAAIVSKNAGLCDRVRVAFTGVASIPFRDHAVEDALVGKAPDGAAISAAAQKAADGVDVLSDHFASEEYRKHLAKVYAKRALTEAAGMA